MNEDPDVPSADGQESARGFDEVVHLKARMHVESDMHRAMLRKRAASVNVGGGARGIPSTF